jgi:XTP/dITP diphosphohydrolase
MKLLFVSRNEHKINEAKALCAPRGVEIEPFQDRLEELQTDDSNRLVQDKLLKAFRRVKRRLIVEHTGLRIHEFADMPAGLTQLFWDKLEAPGFCRYFPNHAVTAFTLIGYCDGQKTHHFSGEINGRIVDAPRGNSKFQWDTVFQPDGEHRTFAEMSPAEKNAISMRGKAFAQFLDYVAHHP